MFLQNLGSLLCMEAVDYFLRVLFSLFIGRNIWLNVITAYLQDQLKSFRKAKLFFLSL